MLTHQASFPPANLRVGATYNLTDQMMESSFGSSAQKGLEAILKRESSVIETTALQSIFRPVIAQYGLNRYRPGSRFLTVRHSRASPFPKCASERGPRAFSRVLFT